MSAPTAGRFNFAKRAHALVAAAILEAITLGVLILAIPVLTGAHTILPLVVVVILLQLPTSLALPVVVAAFPRGATMDVAALVTYGAILFVGQTLFIAWWLNFKVRKATWDPSAAQ
jgi:hypothetical protein